MIVTDYKALRARTGLLALVLIAIAGLPVIAQAPVYRDAMARFEAAKRAGDFARGEAYLIEALRYDRGDEYAWRSLAWCLMRQGKWQESLKVANENIRRNGVCAWSLVQLHESQVVAGDYRDAKRTLEAAYRLRDWQGQDLNKIYSTFSARISHRMYDIEIELVPEGHSEEGRVEFLIPMNCERQRFEKRTVIGADAPLFSTREGKDFVQVTLHKGIRTLLRGKLTLVPSLIGSRSIETARPASLPEVSAYLGKFRHGAVNTYDPELSTLKQVSADVRDGSAVETTRSILAWLKKEFRYEPLSTDDLPSILKARHGVCHHYCGLFCAMARAKRVPAKILHVTALPELSLNESRVINAPGTPTSAHGQNEVWLGSVGWVPLEPQQPSSLGNYENIVILFNRSGNGPDDNHWKYRSAQGCRMTVRLVELNIAL